MASLVGSKRAAEDEASAELAPAATTAPAPAEAKISKKHARRLRKMTPAQKIELEYRVQIGQCARQSDPTRALELYERMKAEKVRMEAYIFHVVISLCSKAEDLAAFKPGAFQVYEDMKQLNSSNSAASKKSAVDESTYSALVKLCSKDRDWAKCEELLAAMEAEDVTPRLRTFAPLLQAYSEAGDLDKTVWVHDKILAHGLEPTEAEYVALLRVCVTTGNAERFYAFLDAFIENVWQPGREAWQVLKDWFNSEAAQVDGRKWTCVEGTVDEQGVCSVTGEQLQSLELAPDVEQELLDKVEKLVRTDEKRIAQWDEFKQWLEENGPFDVLIDAANVGYSNQNFEGGGFSYEQIAQVLEHYEAQQKRALLVLHRRRTTDEEVPPEHRAMVADWRTRGVMYNCEAGNNDDWYWLYAAVKLGGRTLVVSNDEMRDHHFQMIHTRVFTRWKERHLAHYELRGRRLDVHEPTPFSARPQRVGDTWHFPLRATASKDEASEGGDGGNAQPWLCVQLEEA